MKGRYINYACLYNSTYCILKLSTFRLNVDIIVKAVVRLFAYTMRNMQYLENNDLRGPICT